MTSIEWNPGPVNATAYAALGADGKNIVAIINNDGTKDSTRALKFGRRGYTTELALTAQSLDSRSAMLGNPPVVQRTGTIPPGSATLFREL